MNSNLPMGAANDPDNPWDSSDTYCPECESQGVANLVDQYLRDHPDCEDWDEAYEKVDEFGCISICRDCHYSNLQWELEDYDD